MLQSFSARAVELEGISANPYYGSSGDAEAQGFFPSLKIFI